MWWKQFHILWFLHDDPFAKPIKPIVTPKKRSHIGYEIGDIVILKLIFGYIYIGP